MAVFIDLLIILLYNALSFLKKVFQNDTSFSI